ncbi:hypothetical protein VTK73DRAFT_1529 [Phialemonium thermophilum]|uniref:Xylanolytic transcriptional activator regulatory domain-containing protein n=1 Tax=Phialemonium thermophilum TaxID=223376 RepID=A0ABR3X902_9PEZI
MPSPLATQGSTAGSSSAPGTPSGEPQRRPTKERLRVSRACDECKKWVLYSRAFSVSKVHPPHLCGYTYSSGIRKKIRCTGQNPCQRCSRDGVACHYDAPYLRGKRKSNREKLNGTSVTPPSSTSPFNRDTITGPQHRSDRRPPSPRDDDEGGLPQESIRVAGGTPARRPPAPGNSSRASPAPGESDRQGHFVGASSGLSFLLRLQRRLRRDARDAAAAESPVFTLRDTVLPEFDELAFTLPRREEANALLTTYFELSSPTYRFLHRPTIEFWLQQLYDTGVIAGPNFHSKYAVILTMFAQATRYTGAASNSPDANTGLQYFQAAERQLSRETEPATLTSVQALLGCCFYILTRSRLNHCWNLFGTTSRLILALGMHRRKEKFEGGAPSACGVDLVELECRKRVFWCAYNLDKYLSAIFGRPCAFHDDDIDQDMPS